MFGKKNLSVEEITTALKQVHEPELHQDLVTLNMVKDIRVKGENVRLKVVLTTPACPYKEKIEADVRRVIQELPGVKGVEIEWGADVPHDGRTRGLAENPIRNAIAVASGKGGVGKSTVAVNLAVVLAQSGARVGLLDADIYGPNVPTMMGLTQLPPPRNNKMVPAEAYGVKVISIGFLVEPGQPLIWRGPMLHTAIRQFIQDVAWGELDYLIVDLPPGTGDAPLSVAQSLSLSGGVIVTLPQQVSLDDARRGLEMFRQLNVEIFGVIENMSYLQLPDGSRLDVFGTGGGEKLAREAQVPYIGGIPMDPSVRVGGDTGTPVIISHPDSPVSQALWQVGRDVAARVSVAALRSRSSVPINVIG